MTSHGTIRVSPERVSPTAASTSATLNVHTEEPVRSILDAIARKLGVPLRHRSSRLRHDGRFYGQTRTGEPLTTGITAAHLVEMLRGLPDGVTEVACHPGFADDLVTMYHAEREVELGALCDPSVRRAHLRRADRVDRLRRSPRRRMTAA